MSSFINNLIHRSASTAAVIQPRLRGKFERQAAPSESFETTEETASAAPPPMQETIVHRERITSPETRLPITRPEKQPVKNPAAPQTIRAEKASEQVPEATPQRPPRFEPSHAVTVPAPIKQEHLPVKNDADDHNTNEQTKLPSAQRLLHGNNKNPQQIIPQQAALPPVTSAAAKELHQPSPRRLSKASQAPATPLPTRQALVASLLQKQTTIAEPSRTINVSIGRIEVRLTPPPAAPAAKAKKEGLPVMGLDEYLQKRNQRGQ